MTQKPLPPISYENLIEQLTDPTSDLDYFLQYMLEIQVPQQMAPELAPNPSLVTNIPPETEGGVAMGAANFIMRRRRHRAYRKRIKQGWSGHRIVSEGDSWFQYPTKLQDIIDHLMKDHAILSLGAAGDELKDIQRQREILLNLRNERASALLLSAGGNDLFDKGQLGRLVEEPFPGATAKDLVGETFTAFLTTILERFLDVFRRVHTALPHVHILVHGYGPAFPRGGDWIEKPLTERGVPKEIQHDVLKLILKKFNFPIGHLTARSEFRGRLDHLDLTDIGENSGDWHDEIHLNGPNAAKAAARFRKELKKRLSAPVPETGISNDRFAARSTVVSQQAEMLSALDEGMLLQELDMRVALLEMDPTVAEEAQLAPLVIGREMPEAGITSLGRATRQLIRSKEADLHDLICGGTAGNALEKAILKAIEKGKSALAGAIASWLVSGPFAVPAVIASVLAAWLASKILELGQTQICKVWQVGRPASPVVLSGVVETGTPAQTLDELRGKLTTPAGGDGFTSDTQKERLERLDEALADKVVQPPMVPVDADGAARFRQSAATIFEMLGGEVNEFELDPEEFGFAEAMIMIDGSRPALYVRDGFVDLNDPSLIASGWHDEISAHENSIRRQIAASGRVIWGSDRSADQVYGSAWMLEGGRVATARHVLEAIADNFGGDSWFLKDTFFVDFSVEADRPVDQKTIFKIEGVDWAGPNEIGRSVNLDNVDAAILRLAPNGIQPFPEPIALAGHSVAQEAQDTGWFMNVGHPAQPRGTWLVDTEDGNPNTISKALVFALIGDRFGVKRLSPGRIDFKPGKFPGDQQHQHAFTHNATTLGGSSGSSIMSLTDTPVISGLHFAGLFGTRNYAHFIPPISKDWA